VSEQFVNLIHDGMHIEDADGDKIGTVLAIYQPVRVISTGFSSAEPAGDAYLKVHVGLPLLGKNLYIPASAIRDVTADRIILRVDESRLDEQGWDERPAWIGE
jgi:hypothetical protein